MRDSTWTLEGDKTDPVLKSKPMYKRCLLARRHVVISRKTCYSAIEGRFVPWAAYKSAYKKEYRQSESR